MAENDFFTELAGTDKRTNIPSTISSPVWSGGATTLTAFYTGSAQSGSSGDYYYDVFDKVGTDTTREVQFAIAYGHFDGSGSLSTSAGNNPSKAVYRQFRNICIRNANSDSKFEFPENNTNVFKGIYVINVNRARYRERLDPGNWELHLGTGDPGLIKLIDDSGATADSSVNASQRVFNVISGSIATGTAVTPADEAASDFASSEHGSYGLFYPELGLIILNATRLDRAVDAVTAPGLALGTVESTGTNDDNSMKLYNKLIIAGQGSGYFQSRREEQIKSSHFFCRVESDKYNWSQNPTYFDSTTTELTNTTFIQDPKAYITTVGLYNDNNELLAVAKLSQPLLKSRDREAVIKVRLDF
jgi:hypothetical protein